MKTLQIGLEWFSERAGGLPRYYGDLFNNAARADIDFRGLVVGTDKVARDTNGAITAFSPAERPLFGRLLAARRTIVRRLREDDPDLVVSHFALHAFPALDVIDRPLVCHFHGPWADESRDGGVNLAIRAKAWIEAVVYRRARLNIVLSKAFGDILHSSYGVPWDRIRVIPGAADIELFAIVATCTEARAQLGWPTDRPIILAVRRLVPRMGLENLIRAMTDVVRRFPNVLLLIGGRGMLGGELEKLIAELGLAANVRLLGFIPDQTLPLAYRAADLTVVPTVELEGFGLIAAESLAAGTPVLVTPVGGLPEVVIGLSQELILNGTTSFDIANGLCHAFDTPSLPNAEACMTYARERFNWRNCIETVHSVYAEALR